jgi:hypothetical protein
MSGTSEKDKQSDGDGQVWEVEGRHVEVDSWSAIVEIEG